MDIVWENKSENIIKVEKLIQNAVDMKIDCLLFPEMSLSGFSMNTQKIGEKEDVIDTIKQIKALCLKYDLFLGIGYAENGIDKAFNKYAIINNQGTIIANYTKIHPFSYGEESIYYAGGDKVEYCDINEVKTTPFICYDLRFPEIFQIASAKAQLITIAANWPIQRRDHWITLLQARAIENQCYIAGVNRVGFANKINYSGDSMIINPYGEIISDNIDGEGIVSAEIDIRIVSQYREKFRLKTDRREKLYTKLQQFPI